MARRRSQWASHQNRVDPSRLVFIDETWTKTNMAPLRGWAPRGERLKAKVPQRRWQTMTFMAALRQDGVTAPWHLTGPINGERFRLYIERVLAPKGLTPYEFICKAWTKEPERFTLNPLHQMPGLNI